MSSIVTASAIALVAAPSGGAPVDDHARSVSAKVGTTAALVDSRVEGVAAPAPGLSADPILLPLGDSIGDTTTITVASGVMAAWTPFAETPSNFTFSLASASVRTILAVAQTRVAVDGGDVCNPDYADESCSDVQDVWTFTWDGRDDGAAPVVVGDYTLTSSAIGAVGTVVVRDLVLDAVTSDVRAPFVVAPFVDGVLDSRTVTFTGMASGYDIPTTGVADLISSSGAAVLHHYDFGPTPSVGHDLVLNGIGLAFGNYLLNVDLVSGGVHQVTDFEVTVVQTQALAARVHVSSPSIFPAVDNYRDRARVTLTVTSSTGRPIPVTGTVVVRKGSVVVRRIAVIAGQVAVSWDGRINGNTAPGAYTIAATVKGPQGAAVNATPARVTVFRTTVVAASLRTSMPTVFPERDGYKDGVRITSGTRTSTGGAIRGSQTIEVLRGTRVVTTWTFPNTSAHTVTWNGRDGGDVSAGRYSLRFTVKGPEGRPVVKAVAITVSDKKLVTYSTEGSKTYMPTQAFDSCHYTDYGVCEYASGWSINGRTYPGTVSYYNGIDSATWAAHSIALPTGTTSYRIHTMASTDDSRWALHACTSDATNVFDCQSGWSYPINDYSGGEYITAWTSRGVSDGRADFYIGSTEWGFIHVGQFTVDFKRTWKVLE